MGGDLVDAKTLYMQGHQYQEEWEVYDPECAMPT